MTDQASFQLRESDGIPIIEGTGEIDITNFEQLRSLLKKVGSTGSSPVIVNLEKVAYLDSHTVEVLVEFYKRLNTNRRRLLIVAPRETPAGITLRISNLGLAMPLFESIDEALANTRP